VSRSTTKTRRSNIELMRIVLFSMVVSLHIAGPYLETHFYTGTLNWQFSNLLDGGSRLGSIGFVLIAGYFMSSSKSDRPASRVLKLLPPLAFYWVMYLALYYMDAKAAGHLAGPGSLPLHEHPALRAVMDFLRADGHFYPLWFVQVFIALYLLIPYLNILVDRLEQQRLRNLIIVLFSITSAIPTLVYITGINFYRLDFFSSKLGLFVTLYFIAAYIRKYVQIKVGAGRLFLVFATGEFLIVFLTFLYNSRYSPLIFFKKIVGVTMTYPFSGFLGNFYERSNSLVMATGVVMLLFFLKLDISSRAINWIAAKTYGAYICHVFWINILGHHWPIFSHLPYVIATTALIISVIVCSLATESLRQWLAGLLGSMLREKSG
jgi:surface polysaccharide O-acyltransferase-like enzyme